MAENLKNYEASPQKSSGRAKKLVAKLAVDFEDSMNNDLHVKDAFDRLFHTVSRLVKVKDEGKLGVEDSREAIAKLKAIDQVLQVIF